MENILEYLNDEMKDIINFYGKLEKITELRLRVNRKFIINYENYDVVTDYIVKLKDILDIILKVSENSLYAIQNEINNGFITIKGGHRIGICGEVIMQEDKIKNIKNINSMNIRIAKEIKGCAEDLYPLLLEDGNFTNTLIVSPPGCGKTTLLRDLVRILSRKNNIGVVDERGEIASVYHGSPSLDIGTRTDVLSNCTKSQGMKMLTRTMGVDIIATDEIGTEKDIEAIKEAQISGVKLMFTMHGNSISDIANNKELSCLLNRGAFKNIVILSKEDVPGNIKKIYKQKEVGLFDEVHI